MEQEPQPNRLKELREAKGLTQEEVAKRRGVTITVVSRHESGRRGMSRDAAIEYAQILGVEVWEIYVSPEDLAPNKAETDLDGL